MRGESSGDLPQSYKPYQHEIELSYRVSFSFISRGQQGQNLLKLSFLMGDLQLSTRLKKEGKRAPEASNLKLSDLRGLGSED